VAFADLVADELAQLRLGAQVLERGIGEVVPLGPIARSGQINRDYRRDKRPAVAEGHRFADEGAELELVLDELRRKGRAVAEFPDVLGAVDDDQMAMRIEKARIARVVPAILAEGIPSRFR